MMLKMKQVVNYKFITADDNGKKSFSKKSKRCKISAIRDCTNLAPLEEENLINY